MKELVTHTLTFSQQWNNNKNYGFTYRTDMSPLEPVELYWSWFSQYKQIIGRCLHKKINCGFLTFSSWNVGNVSWCCKDLMRRCRWCRVARRGPSTHWWSSIYSPGVMIVGDVRIMGVVKEEFTSVSSGARRRWGGQQVSWWLQAFLIDGGGWEWSFRISVVGVTSKRRWCTSWCRRMWHERWRCWIL